MPPERIRLTWFAGSGAAKVAAVRSFGFWPGEDTPKAPRAFADPLRLPALAYEDDATHTFDALERDVGDNRSTPDWDRTSNLQLRRLTLYPIELREHWSLEVYQPRSADDSIPW